MARRLKKYQTSIGFYDLAIAAPSMKAALEAWGAESNLFHRVSCRFQILQVSRPADFAEDERQKSRLLACVPPSS
jgi:hypothetical protein